jgi:RNA polymerase sigma factor for flagellar operon FliA
VKPPHIDLSLPTPEAITRFCEVFVPIQAQRYASRNRFLDVDDLIGEGRLAVLKAARDYTPAKGAKFGSYATAKFLGAFLEYARHEDHLPRSVRTRIKRGEGMEARMERPLSLSGFYEDDEERPIYADDDGPEEVACRADEGRWIRRQIEFLPSRERDVVGLSYWGGFSHDAIGQLMGCSPALVFQTMRRAQNRLRGYLAAER